MLNILPIICIIINLAMQSQNVPQAPALYKASDEISTMEDYHLRYQCARIVLSAGYPETPDMPRYEDYEIHNDWDIAMAVYLNGGSHIVSLEDGSTCSL